MQASGIFTMQINGKKYIYQNRKNKKSKKILWVFEIRIADLVKGEDQQIVKRKQTKKPIQV